MNTINKECVMGTVNDTYKVNKKSNKMIVGLLFILFFVSGSSACMCHEHGEEVNRSNGMSSFTDFFWLLVASAPRKEREAKLKRVIDFVKDVDVRDREGSTFLIAAAEIGDGELVDILLARRANINATKIDGSTALIVASAGGHTDIVQLLLAHDADINAESVAGHTALIGAVYYNHIAAVKLLMAAGLHYKISPEDLLALEFPYPARSPFVTEEMMWLVENMEHINTHIGEQDWSLELLLKSNVLKKCGFSQDVEGVICSYVWNETYAHEVSEFLARRKELAFRKSVACAKKWARVRGKTKGIARMQEGTHKRENDERVRGAEASLCGNTKCCLIS